MSDIQQGRDGSTTYQSSTRTNTKRKTVMMTTSTVIGAQTKPLTVHLEGTTLLHDPMEEQLSLSETRLEKKTSSIIASLRRWTIVETSMDTRTADASSKASSQARATVMGASLLEAQEQSHQGQL